MKVLDIIEAVEDYTGVGLIKMRAKSRRREVVEARWYAMYLLRYYTDMTFLTIGEFLERDHSTVIHGLTEIEYMMSVDKRKRAACDLMEARIKKVLAPIETIPIYSIDHVFKTA